MEIIEGDIAIKIVPTIINSVPPGKFRLCINIPKNTIEDRIIVNAIGVFLAVFE